MCSLPPYFWAIYRQAIAYHQQLLSSHQTRAHTLLLFCLPVCLGLCLPFKSMPLFNSPHPFLSPSMCLHLHFLARFFPISPLLKSETAQNPMRFFFGQPRGNGSERKAQVRLQLLIKNLHCPAWRDVRNDFGFHLSKVAMSYMHWPIWRYIVHPLSKK